MVEGLRNKDVEGVVVYDQGGELLVYHKAPDDCRNQSIQIEAIIDKKCRIKNYSPQLGSLPSIETFYFQGHFIAEFSYDNLCTTGLSGLYNASESYLLRKDLENSQMRPTYILQAHFLPILSAISRRNIIVFVAC